MLLRPTLLCLALLSALPVGAIPAVDRSTPALRVLAEQGSPAAMARLGWHYYHGEGVAKDMLEAAKWFRAAAEQGNPSGLFGLSRILRWGHGVPQNIEAGDRMMMDAAEKGDAQAQVAAGRHAERAQASNRAREWFEKAAAQGDSEGQRYLGYMVLHGQGGARDGARGLNLLRQSVDQGNIDAMVNLAEAYEMVDGGHQDLARARELYRRAAAYGNADASLGLARLLQRGKGGPRDSVEAMQLFTALADKGNARAALILASIYDEGSGDVAANPTEMLRWLARAVDLGAPRALAWQGRLYDEGTRLPADSARAVALFTRAAQSGYPYAKYMLGKCLEEGKGVAKDEARALALYREASTAEPMALYRQAAMLLDGRGTARDPAAVLALVDSGLARGEAAAMLQLAALLLSSHGRADTEPLVQRVMQHPASSGASARGELAFAMAVGYVGQAYQEANRLDDAQSWLLEQVALLEKLPPQDNHVMVGALRNLGTVQALRRQGALADDAFARSVALLRGAEARPHGALAEHHASIASAYARGDYFSQSEQHRRLALKLYEEAGQSDTLDAIQTLGSLGVTLHHLGRYDEAAALLVQAADRATVAHGKSNSLQLHFLLNLGDAQLALGQYDAAEASFRSALALANYMIRGQPSHMRATALLALGTLEARRQRYEKAEGWLLQSLKIHERLSSQAASSAAVNMMELGKVLMETGRYQQADAYLARALHMMAELPASAGWEATEVLHEMGRSQAKQGKHALAAEYFERALAVRTEVQPIHHKTRETGAALASVYRSLGRDATARELEERIGKAAQEIASSAKDVR